MQFRLFETAVYTRRRSQLIKKMSSGLIILMGNEESSMNYKDNWYPFRQDSNFLYYFGINTGSLAAVIDADSGEEIIFGNELTIEDIVWTGPLPSLGEMAAAVGVSKTKPYNQIETIIRNAINSGRQIYFTPPYRPENKIKLAQWLQVAVDAVSEMASVLLIKAIISQRESKEECEVEEEAGCGVREGDVLGAQGGVHGDGGHQPVLEDQEE